MEAFRDENLASSGELPGGIGAMLPARKRATWDPISGVTGVLIFQFVERVPAWQAAELVKYHLGWKLALNLKPGAVGFHPTIEF